MSGPHARRWFCDDGCTRRRSATHTRPCPHCCGYTTTTTNATARARQTRSGLPTIARRPAPTISGV